MPSLAALMLACLRMTINEAIEALRTAASAVFSEEPQPVKNPYHNFKSLKGALEGILQTMGVAIDAKCVNETNRPRAKCKGFIQIL